MRQGSQTSDCYNTVPMEEDDTFFLLIPLSTRIKCTLGCDSNSAGSSFGVPIWPISVVYTLLVLDIQYIQRYVYQRGRTGGGGEGHPASKTASRLADMAMV